MEHEEMLRKAMLSSDLKTLDELIHDNLIFVNHFGQILTKEADIEAYRSGVLNFTDIKILDQKVILLENSAVTVTVPFLTVFLLLYCYLSRIPLQIYKKRSF